MVATETIMQEKDIMDIGKLESQRKIYQLPNMCKMLVMHLDSASSAISRILNTVWFFDYLVNTQIRMTPWEQCIYKLILCKMWTSITTDAAKIQRLQTMVKKRKSKLKTNQKGYEIMARNNNETSQVEMLRYLGEGVSKTNNSKDQRHTSSNILQAEINSLNMNLLYIRERNISIENKFRMLRLKAQNRYDECIAKYDKNIVKYHKLLRILTFKKDVMKAKLNDLEHQMTIQHMLYSKLKEEQKVITTMAFIEMLEDFKINRAARIIQRAWRIRCERISEKKKKRPRKKL